MSGKITIHKTEQLGLTIGKEYEVLGTFRTFGYLFYKVVGDDGWIKVITEDEVDGDE